MFLSHLSLAHFRNYRSLSLDFDAPLTLVQGGNGQGKTNLLEAIFYLATSKSSQARAEREVVGWDADDEPLPFSRIRGDVQRRNHTISLEILFTPRRDGVNYTKQVRINGAPRRSLDLIGNLRAVLFLPEDIVLISGAPGERRRYLDIALCQIDRSYCQELSRYQKVVTQRNSLLRQLREQGAAATAPSVTAQLGFWDEQLVTHGARILARRLAFLSRLEPIAQERQRTLSAGEEELRLLYRPSFNPGLYAEAAFQRLRHGDFHQPPGRDAPLPDLATITRRFEERLSQRRPRELAAGNTLYGPHRDDLIFLVNGWDLRLYGSRGQQRTGALALKLAEMQAMHEETGETPILLLDDVMSELDARRRGALLTALAGVRQAIVTTTDWDDFSPEFRRNAQRIHVQDGRLIPAPGEVYRE